MPRPHSEVMSPPPHSSQSTRANRHRRPRRIRKVVHRSASEGDARTSKRLPLLPTSRLLLESPPLPPGPTLPEARLIGDNKSTWVASVWKPVVSSPCETTEGGGSLLTMLTPWSRRFASSFASSDRSCSNRVALARARRSCPLSSCPKLGLRLGSGLRVGFSMPRCFQCQECTTCRRSPR